MPNRTRCQLSVVLPMYKPKTGWPATLFANMEALNSALPDVDIEYIVVNDGFETPGLKQMFELLSEVQPNLRFISYPTNMGKGFALRTGVAAATGYYTIITDFDFPYQEENIVGVYQKLLQGYDVVAGKRQKVYYDKVPFKRKLISYACNQLNKWLVGLPDCDAQSGLKGFNLRGKRTLLATRINRFLMDTEFLMLAYQRELLVGIEALHLKEGVVFSNMSKGVLLAESRNLLTILQTKKGRGSTPRMAYYVEPQNIPDL